MLFYDTETVGFHGIAVLLQYAKNDGEIKLHHIWKEPIGETLELIEWIMSQEVCGFNLAFDHFHLSKIYTIFTLLLDQLGPDAIPEEYIGVIAIAEEKARFLDICIKPKAAIDIMLHARKGPYQSLMARNDIRVKKIPTLLSEAVRSELEKRIELDGIYFAKRKDPTASQWQIKDIIVDGEMDFNFKDVILKFHASGQLKELAKHALKIEKDFILKFTDIEVHPRWKPVELGYAPFALAIGKPGNWKGAWPEVIKHYISHWFYNPLAKKYAQNDIVYTRDLYKFFGSPESGDDDSELACSVGAARWRGFNIDIDKIKEQRSKLMKQIGKIPTAPKQARYYIEEVMNDTEKSVALIEGTKAEILESIAGKENIDGVWEYAWIQENETPHPAAIRAKEVLQARRNIKEKENYDKLLRAKHFHASFKVIGTLSSRMAGADKLNPQGIKAKKHVRSCFPLADFNSGFVLSGGDFVSFEVVLAEAVYNDPKLREDLLKVVVCSDCNGSGCKDCKNTGKVRQSIHGLFAVQLFKIDYDAIMAAKKTTNYYTDGKRGIFSQLYGGNERTMVKRLGIDLEVAAQASEGFMDRYPGIRKARQAVSDRFCSMRQPGGIGTAVEWHEPAEYEESLLGFRRYFTLENKICKALFDLANKPPEKWKNARIKVKRRDRLQTASGACQSALYAAAFNIQSQSMRQAANQKIQSSGAQITKRVQRKIWDIQPHGAHPWRVRSMNVHDEIHVVTRPKYVDQIAEVVNETVESFREKVPLIEIDWNKEEQSWADK